MLKILFFSLFLITRSTSGFDPQNHKNWNLLPNDICGLAHSERIIGGEEAPMNAYPWIARIGYVFTSTKQISFRCGGVVINKRTVLTAAHCVANLPNEIKVNLVRLGEHDTETDPDCEMDFCADPVQDIEVSEIIHPKNYNKPPFKNDIALIRLAKDIKFSASVKPICMVSDEIRGESLVGSIAEVAGWGVYDIDNFKTSTKLQVVRLPIVGNQECVKHLSVHADIGPTQLCVGGKVGKDSCSGDSGGPLMKVYDGDDGPRYFLLGVVSFGSKLCGKSSMPGVYTKMSAYTKWVLDNLESTNRDSVKVS